MINPKIFKRYDIRGLYPKEINKESAETIAKATVRLLKAKNLVIARDNRASSLELFNALKKGLLSEGVNVIDIGLSPTPMFYFAVWNYGFDGGIMVTASHNPPRYNGFKIVKKGAVMISANTGMDKLREIALDMGGTIEKKNVLKEYLKFNLRNFDLEKIKGIKIVIDTGNTVSGVLIKELKKQLPCKIFHLFPKLDSNFPNHSLNPLEDKNIKLLKEAVKKKKADLGVIFDGDGDRIVFVDEKGERIPSDIISALLAKNSPNSKIVYTICSSNIIKDVSKVAVKCKVGHTYVKEKMKKEKADFACEYSGHYFYKKHNFCEAPILVLLNVLKIISREKTSISQIVSQFKKYYSVMENIRVKDKKSTLMKLEKKYSKGKISHIDGLRVDFKDWWFLARPSNTEDLLRLTVEGKDKNLVEEKLKELKSSAFLRSS